MSNKNVELISGSCGNFEVNSNDDTGAPGIYKTLDEDKIEAKSEVGCLDAGTNPEKAERNVNLPKIGGKRKSVNFMDPVTENTSRSKKKGKKKSKGKKKTSVFDKVERKDEDNRIGDPTTVIVEAKNVTKPVMDSPTCSTEEVNDVLISNEKNQELNVQSVDITLATRTITYSPESLCEIIEEVEKTTLFSDNIASKDALKERNTTALLEEISQTISTFSELQDEEESDVETDNPSPAIEEEISVEIVAQKSFDISTFKNTDDLEEDCVMNERNNESAGKTVHFEINVNNDTCFQTSSIFNTNKAKVDTPLTNDISITSEHDEKTGETEETEKLQEIKKSSDSSSSSSSSDDEHVEIEHKKMKRKRKGLFSGINFHFPKFGIKKRKEFLPESNMLPPSVSNEGTVESNNINADENKPNSGECDEELCALPPMTISCEVDVKGQSDVNSAVTGGTCDINIPSVDDSQYVSCCDNVEVNSNDNNSVEADNTAVDCTINSKGYAFVLAPENVQINEVEVPAQGDIAETNMEVQEILDEDTNDVQMKLESPASFVGDKDHEINMQTNKKKKGILASLGIHMSGFGGKKKVQDVADNTEISHSSLQGGSTTFDASLQVDIDLDAAGTNQSDTEKLIASGSLRTEIEDFHDPHSINLKFGDNCQGKTEVELSPEVNDQIDIDVEVNLNVMEIGITDEIEIMPTEKLEPPINKNINHDIEICDKNASKDISLGTVNIDLGISRHPGDIKEGHNALQKDDGTDENINTEISVDLPTGNSRSFTETTRVRLPLEFEVPVDVENIDMDEELKCTGAKIITEKRCSTSSSSSSKDELRESKGRNKKKKKKRTKKNKGIFGISFHRQISSGKKEHHSNLESTPISPGIGNEINFAEDIVCQDIPKKAQYILGTDKMFYKKENPANVTEMEKQDPESTPKSKDKTEKIVHIQFARAAANRSQSLKTFNYDDKVKIKSEDLSVPANTDSSKRLKEVTVMERENDDKKKKGFFSKVHMPSLGNKHKKGSSDLESSLSVVMKDGSFDDSNISGNVSVENSLEVQKIDYDLNNDAEVEKNSLLNIEGDTEVLSKSGFDVPEINQDLSKDINAVKKVCSTSSIEIPDYDDVDAENKVSSSIGAEIPEVDYDLSNDVDTEWKVSSTIEAEIPEVDYDLSNDVDAEWKVSSTIGADTVELPGKGFDIPDIDYDLSKHVEVKGDVSTNARANTEVLLEKLPEADYNCSKDIDAEAKACLNIGADLGKDINVEKICPMEYDLNITSLETKQYLQVDLDKDIDESFSPEDGLNLEGKNNLSLISEDGDTGEKESDSLKVDKKKRLFGGFNINFPHIGKRKKAGMDVVETSPSKIEVDVEHPNTDDGEMNLSVETADEDLSRVEKVENSDPVNTNINSSLIETSNLIIDPSVKLTIDVDTKEAETDIGFIDEDKQPKQPTKIKKGLFSKGVQFPKFGGKKSKKYDIEVDVIPKCQIDVEKSSVDVDGVDINVNSGNISSELDIDMLPETNIEGDSGFDIRFQQKELDCIPEEVDIDKEEMVTMLIPETKISMNLISNSDGSENQDMPDNLKMTIDVSDPIVGDDVKNNDEHCHIGEIDIPEVEIDKSVEVGFEVTNKITVDTENDVGDINHTLDINGYMCANVGTQELKTSQSEVDVNIYVDSTMSLENELSLPQKTSESISGINETVSLTADTCDTNQSKLETGFSGVDKETNFGYTSKHGYVEQCDKSATLPHTKLDGKSMVSQGVRIEGSVKMRLKKGSSEPELTSTKSIKKKNRLTLPSLNFHLPNFWGRKSKTDVDGENLQRPKSMEVLLPPTNDNSGVTTNEQRPLSVSLPIDVPEQEPNLSTDLSPDTKSSGNILDMHFEDSLQINNLEGESAEVGKFNESIIKNEAELDKPKSKKQMKIQSFSFPFLKHKSKKDKTSHEKEIKLNDDVVLDNEKKILNPDVKVNVSIEVNDTNEFLNRSSAIELSSTSNTVEMTTNSLDVRPQIEGCETCNMDSIQTGTPEPENMDVIIEGSHKPLKLNISGIDRGTTVVNKELPSPAFTASDSGLSSGIGDGDASILIFGTTHELSVNAETELSLPGGDVSADVSAMETSCSSQADEEVRSSSSNPSLVEKSKKRSIRSPLKMPKITFSGKRKSRTLPAVVTPSGTVKAHNYSQSSDDSVPKVSKSKKRKDLKGSKKKQRDNSVFDSSVNTDGNLDLSENVSFDLDNGMSTSTPLKSVQRNNSNAHEPASPVDLPEETNVPVEFTTTYKVVIAIDFGSTFSGYAYCFPINPEEIFAMRRWQGGDPGVRNAKMPSTLLLTPEGEFHSFGYVARDFYHDMEHKEAQKWLYFDKFKMALHTNQCLDLDTEIEACNGIHVPAIRLFELALTFFRERALKDVFDRSDHHVDEQDIRWVLTVPAIWKQQAKQFMRKAAYLAGIGSSSNPDQLMIALEPEAASIYIRQLKKGDFIPEKNMRRSIIEMDKNESLYTIPENLIQGCRYIVVDCGGGTVDITVHQVQDYYGLVEVNKASGGTFGSINVDRQFQQLLVEIYGQDFIEEFKIKRPAGWVDLMIAFEARKRNINPWKNNPLNVSLPFSFIDYYKKFTRTSTVEQALKVYNSDDVRWSPQGMMRFTLEGMQSLFQPSINCIMECIDQVLNQPNIGEVSHLFIVGGFAESPLVQKMIRNQFQEKLQVIIPPDVTMAVVKGAVMYGMDPTVIRVRKSKMTYGVGVLNKFDPHKHPQTKKVVKDKMEWCLDVFDKLVEIDQSIHTGEKVCRSYRPATPNQTEILISMYCSENKNVKFITDVGVKRFGTLKIDLSTIEQVNNWQQREIKLTMQYGDTEIKISALDVLTGNCVKANLNFEI